MTLILILTYPGRVLAEQGTVNNSPLSYEKALPHYSKGTLPSTENVFKWLNKLPTIKMKKRTPASFENTSLLDGIHTCNKEEAIPEFDREMWIKRWKIKPNDCQDIRQKILIRDHSPHRALKFESEKQCEVKQGYWKDKFSKKSHLKNARDAQVTHTVPLRNVHSSGGYKWSPELRALYVNNLEDRDHLIVVSYEKNIERAGKDPGAFLPEDPAYRCEYIGAWIRIKKDWELCMTEEEQSSLRTMAIQCAENYNRDHWVHWDDDDADCLDTRNEVLMRDSIQDTRIERLYDKMGRKKECKVTLGTWYDPFTYNDDKNLQEGERNTPILINDELDVDHTVPLKNAHISGGWAWPAWKKQEYANYLHDRNHLLAVSSSENRSKAAKGPEEYLPPARKFRCSYVKIWTKIKNDWALAMNEAEKTSIRQVLKECQK